MFCHSAGDKSKANGLTALIANAKDTILEQYPDEDLHLCICVPGGKEFEIYIVVSEREQQHDGKRGFCGQK